MSSKVTLLDLDLILTLEDDLPLFICRTFEPDFTPVANCLKLADFLFPDFIPLPLVLLLGDFADVFSVITTFAAATKSFFTATFLGVVFTALGVLLAFLLEVFAPSFTTLFLIGIVLFYFNSTFILC
jgi:hypothetical protein